MTREGIEHERFFRFLKQHPGEIVGDNFRKTREVQFTVDAAGGYMYYCSRCDWFASPNSPCGCHSG